MLRKTATHAWKHLRGPRPRWFGHPTLILAIITVLAIDFASLPGGFRRGGSMVKHTFEHLTGKYAGRTVSFAFFPAMFFSDGQNIELVWDTVQPVPGQMILSDLDKPGSRVNYDSRLVGWPRQKYENKQGFYHITHEETSFRFSSIPSTPEERRRMMALFIKRYDALPPTHELAGTLEQTRRLYAQGKATERTPIPIGYYRNAVALTLLALLVLAFARGRTDLHLHTWHHRLLKRPHPWQCKTCRYDVRGLEQCPECGTPVEGDA